MTDYPCRRYSFGGSFMQIKTDMKVCWRVFLDHIAMPLFMWSRKSTVQLVQNRLGKGREADWPCGHGALETPSCKSWRPNGL